jgi:phosphoribosylformylglycinamidine synthase
MSTLHRIEVRTRQGASDPRAEAVHRRAKAAGLSVASVSSAKVYLLEGGLGAEALGKAASGLLADPVVEVATLGQAPASGAAVIEVHPLPGVMDPAAHSVREGLKTLLGMDVTVSTGVRYDLTGVGVEEAHAFASRELANGVVHQITKGSWTPASLPKGHEYELKVGHVPLRDLTDEQLTKLSREAHLFLSLEEMKTIQAEYRRLGREPRDIELETLAQTWSEHCVHKTLKSRVRYREQGGQGVMNLAGRAGHATEPDGSVVIDNLLKRTVAAATFDLIASGIDWTLSVFKDNSGVIALDDTWGVCIKVETHNHPSALEPYGGSATGIGGCIRDIIGTGLGAKPIASTDVFCVGFPNAWGEGAAALPPGTLHPKRILTDVVSGVRDYGNRMGIPTVNGAVHFNDRFVGNPLVFCGCVGLIPRTHVKGGAKAGDRIIALGGRTGRDGIHGATFSSAELESTASSEFSHAVQIGNAIEEKRTLDAILRAREAGLYHGITDCGAGGFSSAVGEMGAELGAQVDLERAPLKYAGLSYTEIWISEAQERMVLAVAPDKVPAMAKICEEEGVELADLGVFGTPGAELILRYKGVEVGRMPMRLLHEGIPQPLREATWSAPKAETAPVNAPATGEALRSLLSHPNIASKHWIVRQYDHEVQGNTVVKPLCGPGGRGPSDAAVVEPVSGSGRGIALGCGLQIHGGVPSTSHVSQRTYGGDPYLTTLAGIDECVRNLVCTGADPLRIAILDNFCWPSCEKPENLGTLVRAAEACYDGAMAYRTPFVSGKDSLNNQLRYQDPATGEKRVIEIPPTLLITGMGIVQDVNKCVTMDAKHAGNALLLVGATTGDIGGSHFAQRFGDNGVPFPRTDLKAGPATAKAVAACIAEGLVKAAHDCSDGGMLVAVAEMLIATTGAGAPLGAALSIEPGALKTFELAFSENPSRYVLEVSPADVSKVQAILGTIPCTALGVLDATGTLAWPQASVHESVEGLAKAWLTPLAW